MPNLFNLGFRPFFLSAGVLAWLLLPLWLLHLQTGLIFSTLPPVLWHGHEMLYGFTVAVIAGFLLTAVQNWTGQRTPFGKPLAALWGLWLAGRVGLLLPGVPPILVALVDLAFLPVLAWILGRCIRQAKQQRNLPFPLILLVLTGANLLIHLEWLGVTTATAGLGLHLATYAIIMMIVLMGGRVIPSFTENRLQQPARRWRWLEAGLPGLTMLALLAALLWPYSVLTVLLATLATLAHGLRWVGWYNPAYWAIPLLWVLHLGYAWVVVGFGLLALSAVGLAGANLGALHAFTVGGIGVLTLGMMARVALGHTGRPLEASRTITLAFVLVNLAAGMRVVFPVVWPMHYASALLGAGLLWSAAFLLFTLIYLPILLRPRVDGRAG